MAMLDPQSLAAFVAVADIGHFVRAADRLGCTQSVVSKRLAGLETRLGVRLVLRNKRSKVALSREGALFLPVARATLAQLGQAETRGLRIASGEVGALRIGHVFSAIITGVLPRLVRELSDLLPDAAIEVSALGTPEQLVAIAEQRIDVALVRPRPSYPANVTWQSVHREGVMLALSADDPLARHPALACAALHDRRFIVPQFSEDVGLIALAAEVARRGKFELSDIVRTADFITAVGLAAAGQGIAVVPTSLTALTLPGLVYRPLADLALHMDLIMLVNADLPPRVTTMLQRFIGAA